MTDTNDNPLKKLSILLSNDYRRGNPAGLGLMDNMHQQVSMALSLGHLTKLHISRYAEPATKQCLEELAALGIKLERSLLMAEAKLLLNLFQPPNHHQLEILKHFKIKNRSEITQIQALLLIQALFSDPANIEQWKHRPPTSGVKQGILFMGGQLNRSMTQLEAQSKLIHYGSENPHKFLEWMHIEQLFLSVNDIKTLKQHKARKITWKRFFQIYDAIKSSGIEPDSINADKIHQHMKQVSLARKKSLSGQLLTRQLNMTYSQFKAPL
jgi:hypothetical protein